jgi:L-aminopeptidase/D-esterase-like protein
MPARPGRDNLITDISGVHVGNAHDSAAMTGVTVIRPPQRAVTAIAVAGGGTGTRETDLLAPDMLVDAVDAIVLSGGSVYGLAAADGVCAALGAEGQGYVVKAAPGVPVSPIVPAAILYDLSNGGDKTWGETPPYRDLGRQALKAAGAGFAIGRAGAGFGARAGQDRGGLGSASVVTEDAIAVGAVMAVNPLGAVRMPGTEAFWAWPFEQAGEFGGVRPPAGYALDLDDWGAAKAASAAGRVNTTIGCIAVNVSLAPAEAQRVAKMALAGFARAIRPVFAPTDGDVLFCLSTGEVQAAGPRPMLLARLGELGAACVARAIARGVWAAR